MFKKIATTLVVLGIVFSLSSAFAVDMDIKLGAAGPADPDKVGFDAALSLNVPLVPMSNDGGVGFYFGVTPGFQWISWEKDLNDELNLGSISASKKLEEELIYVPVMANFQVRFPVFVTEQASAFYINVGAGYSWGMYTYDRPEYTDGTTTVEAMKIEETLSGFVYEATVGFAFKANSNLSILAEVGYRGSEIEKDDYQIDMSGWIAHVGARLSFGGSDF